MKKAIVTTARRPPACFATWLEHHLLTFDTILVFVDDPSEAAIFEGYCQDPRVKVFCGSVFDHAHAPSRIMGAQNLNNDRALTFCRQNGIGWLLSIDLDELFFEAGATAWTNFDAGQVIFTNHEAVARLGEVGDWFKECTLFKMNGRARFDAYTNGKSAVRVSAEAKAFGPHRFCDFAGVAVTPQRPVILHYFCVSFAQWRAKFEGFGSFGDFWWDKREQPMDVPFMLESRDVVAQCVASNDWSMAKAFYAARIPSEEEITRRLADRSFRRFSPLAC